MRMSIQGRRRLFWWFAIGGLAGALLVVARSALAAPDEVITVRPNSPAGWLLIEETATGGGAFQFGPATPPLGDGSARLTTPDSSGRMLLYTTIFTGTRLSDITRLEYATYQDNANPNAAWAISLQLNIDYDLSDANADWQGRLIYEPYQNGTPVRGSWQTWDALAGSWWASGAPGNGLCPQATPCTWAQVLAAWPDAGIQSAATSGLMFKAGAPWPGFIGNVDAFTIGISGLERTFDFEPNVQCSATCYVDEQGDDQNGGTSPADAKRTIQAAVNQVAAGGSVIIASGTYTEHVTIAKNDLTLQGAGATTRLVPPLPGVGVGIAFSGGRSGITIKDLAIAGFLDGIAMPTGPLSAILIEDSAISDNARHGIWVQGAPASDLTFRRIVASDNDPAPCEAGPGRGLWMINGAKSAITIEDSTFNNNCLVGIDISDGSVSGLTIAGNTVVGNGDAGISVLGAEGPQANLIANNTVTDNGRFGIEIKNPRGNVAVRSNTVARTIAAADARDYAGIAVIRRSPGPLNADQPAGVTIAENTVSGYHRRPSGSTGDGFGIVVEGTGHAVSHNLVTDNDIGVQIQGGNPAINQQSTEFFDRGDGAAANVIASYNLLAGNDIGLRNAAGAAAVAARTTCNWWSDISGPLTAGNLGGLGQALVNPTGPYLPWLVYDSDGAADPGFQIPAAFTVSAGGDISAADNDFRRLANALGCAVDDQVITLDGDFDWTAADAAAAWASGVDGVPGNADDDAILVPAGINGVTLTAAAPGEAAILGPGDLPAKNLEGVLIFDGGPNRGWTISNLRIANFDLAIAMFSGSGGATAFNDTRILSNTIHVATDLNPVAAPADVNQNIGLHLAFGTNQRIAGNHITFAGDGVSDPNGGAASVGIQSNTSGGAVYDGLVIEGNRLEVLQAQSAQPETILGIWENAHGHSSTITVRDNSFANLASGNDPAANLQRAFRLTSHSSATSSVTYAGNTIVGANIGMQWLAAADFAANQPISLTGNMLTDVGSGLLIQSNGQAILSGNAFSSTDQLGGTGIDLLAGSVATLSDGDRFSGLGTAIRAAGTLSLSGTTITGGQDGLLVDGAAAQVSLGDAAFAGQSGDYIRLSDSASDLDGRAARFEGVAGADMDASQYAAAQAKIIDKNDDPALGLVVLADPVLSVSPASLSFLNTRGTPPAPAQSFAISAGPAGWLVWETAAPVYGPGGDGWLTCDPGLPASGVVTATATISCQALPGSLPAGVYTATLTVTSTTPLVTGSPQIVAISFEIREPSVALSGLPVDVAESGPTTATYSLRLGSPPSGLVAINLDTSGGQIELSGDGGQTFGSAATIGWTVEGWQEPREIIVRAIDDLAIEGAHTALILQAVAPGSAPEYLDVAVAPIDVSIADNDPLSLTVTAGDGQSALVNTDFALPLQVRVTDSTGAPVVGATVTFTAPAGGASGSFNGSASATAITDDDGMATAPTFTANGDAGTYAVSATVDGAGSAADFMLTNTPRMLWMPVIMR